MILRNLVLAVVMLFISNGCIKESLPELQTSLLEEEGFNYFSLSSVDFEFSTQQYSNVRVFFRSNYDNFNEAQKTSLRGIIVKGEGKVFEFAVDRSFFLDPEKFVGSTVCYELAFKVVGNRTTPFTRFCFEVELGD